MPPQQQTAPAQLPPIGGDVTGMMPPVGADVTSLMGSGSSSSPQVATPQAPQGSALGRAVSGFAEMINPLPLIKMLGDTSTVDPREAAFLRGANAPPGLGNVIRGIVQAQTGEWQKAKESYDKGDYGNAVMYALSTAAPVVGPTVTHLGEKAQQGDVAGAMGGAAALAVPLPVRGAARAAAVTAEPASRLGTLAERASVRRMTDVIAPKGQTAFKRRMQGDAETVAPTLAREPGMSAVSRTGLADKVAEKLTVAEEALDAARTARNPNQLYDTGPAVAKLEEKLRELTAESAAGPEAHAQVESMGLASLPPKAPPPTTPFKDLPVPYKREMRRLVAELEEFQYQDRQWLDKGNEIAREAGNVPRGSRMRAAQYYKQEAKPFIEAKGGTPVYHEVLQGKTGTTRNAMIRSLRGYVEGKAPSPIGQRAMNVVDRRLRDPESVTRPMLPDYAGFDEADVAGPLGQSVIPQSSQPRANQIRRAIAEIQSLGPAASYESLRRLRASHDKVAKTRYSPSMTDDYLSKAGEAEGAADAAAALRETMAIGEPESAAANQTYALWKKASDVLEAAEQTERATPKVLRGILSRGAGATAGAITGGGWGAVLGALIMGGVEKAAASGVTTKVIASRQLARIADALKAGKQAELRSALIQFGQITGQSAKVNALLRDFEDKKQP